MERIQLYILNKFLKKENILLLFMGIVFVRMSTCQDIQKFSKTETEALKSKANFEGLCRHKR